MKNTNIYLALNSVKIALEIFNLSLEKKLNIYKISSSNFGSIVGSVIESKNLVHVFLTLFLVNHF